MTLVQRRDVRRKQIEGSCVQVVYGALPQIPMPAIGGLIEAMTRRLLSGCLVDFNRCSYLAALKDLLKAYIE